MQPESIEFFAMPASKHLRHTYCGYTELRLEDLPGNITSNQVSKVLINSVEQRWRTLGDNTLMVRPAFKQEAQRVVVELKASETYIAPVYRPVTRSGHTPLPDLSMGLSRPSRPSKGGY